MCDELPGKKAKTRELRSIYMWYGQIFGAIRCGDLKMKSPDSPALLCKKNTKSYKQKKKKMKEEIIVM